MKSIITILFLSFCSHMMSAQMLHVVESGNFFYDPDSLTIEVGDTIQWINLGGFHNVNAETNSITGESFDNPESFQSNPTSDAELLTRVFTVAGEYDYDCAVGSHAANGMVAKFVVNESTTSTKEISSDLFDQLDIRYIQNKNSVEVTIGLERSVSNAELSILDLSGRSISTQNLGPLQEGLHKDQIDLRADSPAGIYLVAVRLGSEMFTQKIFKR